MEDYTLSNFRILPIHQISTLTSLDFADTDVLTQEEDIRVRHTNIDKAIALGKSANYITSIIIKTKTELIKIVSKVISHDEEFVYTSDKLKIPLSVVYSIDFAKK